MMLVIYNHDTDLEFKFYFRRNIREKKTISDNYNYIFYIMIFSVVIVRKNYALLKISVFCVNIGIE